MTCLVRTGTGLLVLAVLSVGPAFAQYTPGRYVSPYARPAVSPYINLLRPGANPAVNYYGLVRPQMNMYNSLRSLQQQQASEAVQNGAQAEGPQEVYTGHHAGFMTQNRYFMNNTGTGGGGLGRGGVPGRSGYGAPAGMAGRSGLGGGAALGGVGTAFRR